MSGIGVADAESNSVFTPMIWHRAVIGAFYRKLDLLRFHHGSRCHSNNITVCAPPAGISRTGFTRPTTAFVTGSVA